MISFPLIVVVALAVLFFFSKRVVSNTYNQSFSIYRAEVPGTRTSADCEQQLFSPKSIYSQFLVSNDLHNVETTQTTNKNIT